MSSARRPLLTATAAGTLLCALWFVPSANASQDSQADATARANAETSAAHLTEQARAVTQATAETAREAADDTQLADTGSIDTTPYVVGGTLFLGVGAGFVMYSVRRERMGF
ncbi:LPXTG-domain-containing protein cell wall anchor domain protein [Streptomyces incarnatus]|uniref:LPXTG-domain-containing protein cell wall anchor domain protein n=1 Tax=Streptomyces incarnatus TaxID=665007 RepID=A0ABN4GC40_9ACTN|nr:LPXTG cell wall anchor domain-containing protein [Streptomyces incarnatus]AKJ11145.1 LPXTG-domain-containing protein cell wall anchor domain protein [Streptomyces incarnatus]